jgi:hypothetical protein
MRGVGPTEIENTFKLTRARDPTGAYVLLLADPLGYGAHCAHYSTQHLVRALCLLLLAAVTKVY